MSEQTKPRPTWVLASLELLNERLNAALSMRAYHAFMTHDEQVLECEHDIAGFRRQIVEWKARHGIGEEVTE